MELIYLNATLDSTKEHELHSITPNGFKVTVTYKDNSFYVAHGHKQTIFENVTEVHSLFKSIFDTKDIAFESDILAQGFTRKIEELESVVIELQ